MIASSVFRSVVKSAVVISLALPLRVIGQDRPLVFAHGLTADGGTWSMMAPFLQSRLQIIPFAPTLGWPNSYAVQAQTLDSYLQQQSISNVVVVAHSNGGVLTRRYLTANEAPRARSLLSINSPHRGVPIAANALNGSVFNYVAGTYTSISQVIEYYTNNDFNPGWSWLSWNNVVAFVLGFLGQFETDIGMMGYGTSTVLSALFGLSPTVLPEMVPDSPMLLAQLSPYALQSEALRTQYRISLSTAHSDEGLPFALLYQNPGLIEAALVTLYALSANAYNHYANHPDPILRGNKWMWTVAMNRMACMKANWLQLIGVYVKTSYYNACTYFSYLPNDGVVPWYSSYYPGTGQAFYMPSGEFGNISHRDNTGNLPVAQEVARRLNEQMGIPLRLPPPPAFTASIVGAAGVPYGAECNYSAAVNNGVPYSYQWFVNNASAGTSPFFSITVTNNVELTLVVTGANGATASASKSLFIDPYSSGCF